MAESWANSDLRASQDSSMSSTLAALGRKAPQPRDLSQERRCAELCKM